MRGVGLVFLGSRGSWWRSCKGIYEIKNYSGKTSRIMLAKISLRKLVYEILVYNKSNIHEKSRLFARIKGEMYSSICFFITFANLLFII